MMVPHRFGFTTHLVVLQGPDPSSPADGAGQHDGQRRGRVVQRDLESFRPVEDPRSHGFRQQVWIEGTDFCQRRWPAAEVSARVPLPPAPASGGVPRNGQL